MVCIARLLLPNGACFGRQTQCCRRWHHSHAPCRGLASSAPNCEPLFAAACELRSANWFAPWCPQTWHHRHECSTSQVSGTKLPLSRHENFARPASWLPLRPKSCSCQQYHRAGHEVAAIWSRARLGSSPQIQETQARWDGLPRAACCQFC